MYPLIVSEIFAGTLSLAVKKLPHFPADLVADDALLVPAKEGDAGVDLISAEDVVIPPGARLLVKTGISIAVPAGYEAQVRPRSGNALKRGLTVLNTPGTIDAGYRGEVGVILFNSAPVVDGPVIDALFDALDGTIEIAAVQEKFDLAYSENTIRISRGERIAQLVIARFERPVVALTDELPSSERGTSGFGSTGV